MKKIEEKSFDVKSLALRLVVGVVAVLAVAIVGVVAVRAYNGQLFGDCNNCTINVQSVAEAVGDMLGASGTRFPNGISADTTSPSAGEVRGTTLTITGDADIGGSITGEMSISAITTAVASTTLATTDSGKVFILDATSTEFVLPATTTASGVHYRFVLGDLTTASSSIRTYDLTTGIEGTLIVAGAVVDCDKEARITFGTDFENIGDYVDVWSDGYYWFIGDSGALTALGLACSAT